MTSQTFVPRSARATRSARVAAVASSAALALVLSACGGDSDAPVDDPTDGQSEDSVETVDVPRVAFTTTFFPATYLNTRYGPINFGPDYGMNYTLDDMQAFDGHVTAMQALLSGEAQIIGGSFISTAVLKEQGEDIQIFCPFVNGDTLVLAARNGISEVEQIFEPETRVATDSPGGAGSLVFNALLEGLDAPGLVDDLTNTQILESSSLRASALAADQVDVAVIQMQQFNQMEPEVSDLVLMSSFGRDIDDVVMMAYAAPTDWLAENKQTAVDFCATVLRANDVLSADFELYQEAAETFLEEPPGEEELRDIFDLINDAKIWPDELTTEAVDYTLGLGLRSGVLTEEMTSADLLNTELLESAYERASQSG